MIRTNQQRVLMPIATSSVFRWHLTIIVALIVAHVVLQIALYGSAFTDYNDLRAVFDLDREHSLPNLLSAFAIAVTAAAAAFAARTADSPLMKRGWIFAACVMVFLALDEGAGLHDALSGKVGKVLSEGGTHGVLFSAWVIPYSIAFVATAAILARFALALPKETRWGLLIAGWIYALAAIGLELPEGYVADHAMASGLALDAIDNLPVMVMMHTAEETGEMLAFALALRTILRHIVRHTIVPAILLVDRRPHAVHRIDAGLVPAE